MGAKTREEEFALFSRSGFASDLAEGLDDDRSLLSLNELGAYPRPSPRTTWVGSDRPCTSTTKHPPGRDVRGSMAVGEVDPPMGVHDCKLVLPWLRSLRSGARSLGRESCSRVQTVGVGRLGQTDTPGDPWYRPSLTRCRRGRVRSLPPRRHHPGRTFCSARPLRRRGRTRSPCGRARSRQSRPPVGQSRRPRNARAVRY